jgi:hypothetical protein
MKNLWADDKIQFARLLCEIQANIVGSKKDWASLLESMDLTQEEVDSLFDRAERVWEASKRRVFAQHDKAASAAVLPVELSNETLDRQNIRISKGKKILR